MNKGCRVKFIPGRGKGAVITRNMIQIGNLYSSEIFPIFIILHFMMGFISFQTNKLPSKILTLLPMNRSDKAQVFIPKIASFLGQKGNLSCFTVCR